MKKPFRLLICILLAATQNLQAQYYSLMSRDGQQWQVAPATENPQQGNMISQPGFRFAEGPSLLGPVAARVPATVFTSYVEAGKEEDPNVGDNIHRVDRRLYDRSFWYRTIFSVPSDFRKERVWLNMDGVNRKASVWLNGQFLGELDGFMMRGRYDITELISNENVLAILISIPQMPMSNQSSPSYICSGGWDWIPYVPGLNSGLTDKIWLSNTEAVTISNPWIRSKMLTTSQALLSAIVSLRNSASEDKLCKLEGRIMPGNICFEKELWLHSGTVTDVRFDPESFPELKISNPRLWWPNGYGDPNLYECTFTAMLDGQVSDTAVVEFGIRHYTYDVEDGVFHIKVNGVPVFVKGANWGMPEYMLRCRDEEYATKIALHKEMHFNMIRNWLGSTTDEEFYRQCDRAGIMVWDDFWLNSNPNLPYDIFAFNRNAVEKILRLRNHACIAVWCGENEGVPQPPLAGWLAEDVRTFDGDDRWFQARSNAYGLSGSGYWGASDERYYFLPYPCWHSEPVMTLGWGFRTEIGTAVVPTYESIRKFIPEEHLWPIDDMWNLHYFGPGAGNAQPEKYKEMVGAYGEPSGAEDFCRKAQLVNLQSNKAMFEGWLDHMWNDASGIMTWMGQSAYPSMVWQTYDYYYDMTGAYWGCKSACEPLHILCNPATDEVKISNTSALSYHNLKAEATIYNADGSFVSRMSCCAVADAPANTTSTCFTLPMNHQRRCLSVGKPVFASSTEYGKPEDANDGTDNTRWASARNDIEWIYYDLGERQQIGQIRLNFEASFGRQFRLQVSDDAQNWKEIVKETNGHEGEMLYTFPEVEARYVRFLGIELGWWYGYSLRDFSVWGPQEPTPELSDVYFIRLRLADNQGTLLSENIYWRGKNRSDYSSLADLIPAKLHTSSKLMKKDGKALIAAKIGLKKSAGTVAFATHVYAIRKSDGERLLPAIQNTDYITLFPGDTQTVTIEFDEALLDDAGYELIVSPYNN